MRDHFKSNFQSYYVALLVCAAVLGILGFVYQKTAAAKEAHSESLLTVTTLPTQEAVDAMAPQPIALSPELAATIPIVETPTPLATCFPVDGDRLTEYSVECLSYNETTRDWRTHSGLDLAAEEGTPVLAAAEGTVTDIYLDDTLGTTVVLRHRDGYVTRYSSLAPNPGVSIGDFLEMGTPLGMVGRSAALESTYGDHVHFAVTCDGKTMDPLDFLEPA